MSGNRSNIDNTNINECIRFAIHICALYSACICTARRRQHRILIAGLCTSCHRRVQQCSSTSFCERDRGIMTARLPCVPCIAIAFVELAFVDLAL
jgi:hypothetical protein